MDRGRDNNEIDKNMKKDKLNFLEKDVKKSIYAWLDLYKYLYIPIQNQGQWNDAKKVYTRFTGTRGAPDLMVQAKNGLWVCVELKSSKGKLSEDQREFKCRVKSGNYFIVRSIDDIERVLWAVEDD